MLKVTSNYLKGSDRLFVRKFAHFALRKLPVRPSIVRNSDITIKIVKESDLTDVEDQHDMKDYGAWCMYQGVNEVGRKKFTIIIAASSINKRGKSPLTRLRKVLIDLGHELTHVKQYLNNEVFDYVSGDVRYKGSVFDVRYQHDEEEYYNSPWEIEAYGREWGLFRMFKLQLKEEAKAKN